MHVCHQCHQSNKLGKSAFDAHTKKAHQGLHHNSGKLKSLGRLYTVIFLSTKQQLGWGSKKGGLQEQGHFLCSFETYRQQTPGVDDQIHEQGQQQMAGNYFSGENHISLDPVVHIPVPTI